MGRLAPDGGDGGTAVLERPSVKDMPGPAKAKPKPRDWRDSIRKYAKTVSAIIVDTVTVGNEEVRGDSEPRWDGAYSRQVIALRRQDEQIVNANEFAFRASLDWPGPLHKFLVHNEEGKAIAQCKITKPVKVEAGTEIKVGEGKAVFERIDRKE